MRPISEREVVLFDAGGTLVTLDFDAVRAAIPAPGAAPEDSRLDRAEALARLWADEAVRRRLAPRELWDGYFARVLSGAGVPDDAIPAALGALWRMNREQGLWRRPAPGARAVLAQLKAAGKRMAVVSNAEGQVEQDLIAAGLNEYLETVVDSHHVGVAKPDPRIFQICLDRLGVAAEQCVYVGDVPAFDVAGARAAGIVVVLLDSHGLHERLADVARITRLEELPRLLGAAG